MNFQFSNSQPKLDKAMTTEQFNQIVEAILAGKYSWACVLILRFAGYNPLHYIPYTTYIRLSKENRQEVAQNHYESHKTEEKYAQRKFTHGGLSQLTELDRLETIEESGVTIQGGSRNRWQSEEMKGNCAIAKNLSFNFNEFRNEFFSSTKFTALGSQNNMS